jgi:hypothetical protein
VTRLTDLPPDQAERLAELECPDFKLRPWVAGPGCRSAGWRSCLQRGLVVRGENPFAAAISERKSMREAARREPSMAAPARQAQAPMPARLRTRQVPGRPARRSPSRRPPVVPGPARARCSPAPPPPPRRAGWRRRNLPTAAEAARHRQRRGPRVQERSVWFVRGANRRSPAVVRQRSAALRPTLYPASSVVPTTRTRSPPETPAPRIRLRGAVEPQHRQCPTGNGDGDCNRDWHLTGILR